jgi:hypothetical protein
MRDWTRFWVQFELDLYKDSAGFLPLFTSRRSQVNACFGRCCESNLVVGALREQLNEYQDSAHAIER